MPHKDPEARRVYSRTHYAAHKAEIDARNRAYHAAHKEEIAAQKRAYNAAHKAEIAAQKRAYRAVHKEEIAAKHHTRYMFHKEEVASNGRAYRAAHQEEIAARVRAYNATHKTEAAARIRAYNATHPEKMMAWKAARRARKAGAPLNDLSAAQWEEIKTAYGHRCVYCGRKVKQLTRDHVTPLGPEGPHTLGNIVPACRACNAKKRTGPPLCPVQPLLLTMAPAVKKRRRTQENP